MFNSNANHQRIKKVFKRFNEKLKRREKKVFFIQAKEGKSYLYGLTEDAIELEILLIAQTDNDKTHLYGHILDEKIKSYDSIQILLDLQPGEEHIIIGLLDGKMININPNYQGNQSLNIYCKFGTRSLLLSVFTSSDGLAGDYVTSMSNVGETTILEYLFLNTLKGNSVNLLKGKINGGTNYQ